MWFDTQGVQVHCHRLVTQEMGTNAEKNGLLCRILWRCWFAVPTFSCCSGAE